MTVVSANAKEFKKIVQPLNLDVLETIVDTGLDFSPQDLSQALRYASMQGHEEVVGFLIKKLSNLTQNLAWDPALLCQAAEVGYHAIASILVEAGVDVNATHLGTSPLQLASRNGHDSIVLELLCHGADPNSRSAKDPCKAIQLAASKGYTAVMKHVLHYDADINVIDDNNVLRSAYSIISNPCLASTTGLR